jgi:hypothetical protein
MQRIWKLWFAFHAAYLQPIWGRESVASARAAHRYPECQRVATKLLFCGTSRGGGSNWNSDWNWRLAVVPTRSVHANTLDIGAVRRSGIRHTGSAEIPSLPIEEGLCKVVVLECSHGPGSTA